MRVFVVILACLFTLPPSVGGAEKGRETDHPMRLKTNSPTTLSNTLCALALILCATCHAQFDFLAEGYRFNPESKSVYRLTPDAMPWTSAQSWARFHSIGNQPIPGNLVTIRSQAENDWLIAPDTELTSQSPLRFLWIGFTEADIHSPETGVWSWVSDEPGTYRSQDMTCSRYCNFLPSLDLMEPAPDFAILHTGPIFPGAWEVDTGNSSFPEGPWHGIVEIVEPFAGAHDDANGNRVPDIWEDNNEDGVPDGYENGEPVPAPRNLRAAFGIKIDSDGDFVEDLVTSRLVWEPAHSPDLLGYNVYQSENPDLSDSVQLNENGFRNHSFIIDTLHTKFSIQPPFDIFYYQVESVLNVNGEIQRGYSNIAAATPGQYVFSLPDIRAIPGAENRSRYPIALLNARGIKPAEQGGGGIFNDRKQEPNSKTTAGQEGGGLWNSITVHYPDFVEIVNVERTPLTKNFPEVVFEDHPNLNRVEIAFATPDQSVQPLNGEGAVVNLVFDVTDGTPIGAVGEVRILEASITVESASASVKTADMSDTGTITVDPFFRPGDIDGSGEIAYTDVVACASLAFGVVPHSSFLGSHFLGDGIADEDYSVASADFNNDGLADIADVNRIIAILIAKDGKVISSGNEAVAAKGTGSFEIKMKDTPFATLPGSVEMNVEIAMPPAETQGIAGVAFTVSYATEYVRLKGVELDGGDFTDLFYDQRDYLRGWKGGRVRVIVSSGEDKVINGKMAKVKFETVDVPPVNTSDVPFISAKMAKSSGEDISWLSTVVPAKGSLIFQPTPELDINVFVDNVINAKDLLIFLDDIKFGTQSSEVLDEFSKEWLTPR